LGFVEEGISRFSVVAKAEATRGAGLPSGEKGGEGGGVAGEVIGGLGFDEGHAVGVVEPCEATIGVAGLGKGKEFGASSGDKKDDDAVGANADEVADVTGGEADEGEEDGKGDELRTPSFHGHRKGLEQNGNGVPFLLGN